MVSSRKARGVYERDKDSGVWWIRYADAAGAIHREKVGPYALAVSAYQKRKTQIREEKFFPITRDQRLTFGEIADDFLRAKPNHWSKKTFKIARAWFAEMPVVLVTPQRIQEKLNSLKSFKDKFHPNERELAPATINRYRAIISAIFSWAVRNGRVASSPMKAVPILREHNERIRFLEENEEKLFRAALSEIAPEREPEFTLSLHTGIRQGELLSLKWTDVDLQRGFIHLKKTKSGNGRTIPLTAPAKHALEQLKKQGHQHVSAGHPRWWFDRAIEAAKIENFRWHDIRHTFASRLVTEGASLKAVRDLMGHKTIAMTMRYAHLAPAHLRDAVNLLCRYSGDDSPTQGKKKGSTSTPAGTAVLMRKRKAS